MARGHKSSELYCRKIRTHTNIRRVNRPKEVPSILNYFALQKELTRNRLNYHCRRYPFDYRIVISLPPSPFNCHLWLQTPAVAVWGAACNVQNARYSSSSSRENIVRSKEKRVSVVPGVLSQLFFHNQRKPHTSRQSITKSFLESSTLAQQDNAMDIAIESFRKKGDKAGTRPVVLIQAFLPRLFCSSPFVSLLLP